MHRAVIMGKHFAAACARGVCGQVHSVFDRAINIQIAEHHIDTSLLTILCAESDVMPASLVTSMRGESWHQNGKVGGQVFFTPNKIYLDSVPLIGGIAAAAVWEPMDAVQLAHLPQLTLKEIMIRCEQVESQIKQSGICTNDFPVMQLHEFDVTKLLGLGDGLTPAGDDFLAGMLFAMHFAQKVYRQECGYLPAIAESVLQNMVQRTNEISRHFLRYAAEGLWGGATQSFLLTLFGSDDHALHAAVMDKMSYGATSGMDEMRGILFGLCETIRLFEGGSLCI